MDKKLDLYLQTMESELGALEAEQRNSELREMRQHIEAIVARLVEGGLSESEAVEAAIAQFGAAREVGRELQTASARGESLGRVVIAVLGAGAVFLGFGSLPAMLFESVLNLNSELFPLLMTALAGFAAGAFAGYVAPLRGGRAVLWTFGTMCLLLVTVIAFIAVQANTLSLWSWGLVSLTALMASLWQGAIYGARRAQSRDLTLT